MQLILADHQAIFCAGIARVLANEPNIHILAQCTDAEQLVAAIESSPQSVVLFSSGITRELNSLLDVIQRVGCRSVLIQESNAVLDKSVTSRLDGLILRSVASQQLVACLYRVESGGRFTQRAISTKSPLPDQTCSSIVRRLTPKELQIVALISEGCRNKEVANKLGTKEQVIKNYLRSIYGKVGVSDRLELALFTARHQVLSEVVEAARLTMARSANV